MSGAVGNKGDKLFGGTFWTTQFFVHDFAKQTNKVDVGPFVVTTNVVGFAQTTIVEYGVNSTCVVVYPQPIAYIFALAINRNWFVVFDVIDRKWNQFFGEMVGTVGRKEFFR